MKKLPMTISLQKWGNSTGVRIPKTVMSAAKIRGDEHLEVSISGRSIVLTPVILEEAFTLDQMLAGVTPKRVQKDEDWGQDIGAEVVHD